jgi:hypothetical protein
MMVFDSKFVRVKQHYNLFNYTSRNIKDSNYVPTSVVVN